MVIVNPDTDRKNRAPASWTSRRLVAGTAIPVFACRGDRRIFAPRAPYSVLHLVPPQVPQTISRTLSSTALCACPLQGPNKHEKTEGWISAVLLMHGLLLHMRSSAACRIEPGLRLWVRVVHAGGWALTRKASLLRDILGL